MTRKPSLEPVVTVPLRAAALWRALALCLVAIAIGSMGWVAWRAGLQGGGALALSVLLCAAAAQGWVARGRGQYGVGVRAVRVLPRGTWQVRQGRVWRAIEIERCVRAGGMLTFHASIHRLTPLPVHTPRQLSFTVRRFNVSAERWRKLCVSVAVWAARPARDEVYA